MEEVAIVGAGVCGLRAASLLAGRGVSVAVFDKGRGVGGRTASRHRPGAPGHDHGAQYFTAKSRDFADVAAAWQRAGVVAAWRPRLGVWDGERLIEKDAGGPTRFVGQPSMRAMTEALAACLAPGAVRIGVRVEGVEVAPGGGYLLTSEAETLGRFDRVGLAVPAPQAAPLAAAVAPRLAEAAGRVRFLPTWAALLRFGAPLPVALDAAFGNAGPIAWWAREASKPGRSPDPGDERVVVHAGAAFSLAERDSAPERVVDALTAALGEVVGRRLDPSAGTAHRWLYARPEQGLSVGALVEEGVAMAGDWTGEGGRVQSAWAAGSALAEALLAGGGG